MTDAISKLYAEIGFKVNDKGLKEFNEQIQTLAKTLKSIKTDSSKVGDLNFSKINNSVEKIENNKNKIKKKENDRFLKTLSSVFGGANKSFRKTISGFMKGGLAGGFGVAVSEGIKSTINTAIEAAGRAKGALDFTRYTGENLKRLQFWTALSSITGAGLGQLDIANAMQNIKGKYFEALKANDQQGMANLHFLGVKANRSPEQLLEDMKEEYLKLNDSEKKRLFLQTASQYAGIDIMSLGRMFEASMDDIVKASQKASKMISEQDIRNLDDFNKNIQEADLALQNFKDNVGAGFAESGKNYKQKVTKFLEDEGIRQLGRTTGSVGNFLSTVLVGAGLDIVKGLGDAIMLPGKFVAALSNSIPEQHNKNALENVMSWNSYEYLKEANQRRFGGFSGITFNDNRTQTITANDETTAVDMANRISPSFENTNGEVSSSLYLGGLK